MLIIPKLLRAERSLTFPTVLQRASHDTGANTVTPVLTQADGHQGCPSAQTGVEVRNVSFKPSKSKSLKMVSAMLMLQVHTLFPHLCSERLSVLFLPNPRKLATLGVAVANECVELRPRFRHAWVYFSHHTLLTFGHCGGTWSEILFLLQFN